LRQTQLGFVRLIVLFIFFELDINLNKKSFLGKTTTPKEPETGGAKLTGLLKHKPKQSQRR
jgi:hypothetical protein